MQHIKMNLPELRGIDAQAALKTKMSLIRPNLIGKQNQHQTESTWAQQVRSLVKRCLQERTA